MDTLHVGVEQKYETKNWRRSKMRQLQKKELLLLKNKIKNEDQAMSPDSGITIKIPSTELIRIMDRTTRNVDEYLTDDQINSPPETMEVDRILGIPIVKVELGEMTEIFLVRHLDKDGTFLTVILFAAPTFSTQKFAI